MDGQIRRSFAAVLLCAAMLALSGCGGPKLTKGEAAEHYGQELRDVVSMKVSDDQRKAQMLVVLDQLQALQLRFSRETQDFVAGFRRLNADYDSTRPMFDQLFADYGAKRIRARNAALDLHFMLASLATADEWKAIAKAESKLYEEVDAAPLAGENPK